LVDDLSDGRIRHVRWRQICRLGRRRGHGGQHPGERAFVCYLTATLLVYDLLKPVNRNLSLLAAFFSITGCAIGALSMLFQLAPLVVLGGAQYLSVFTVEQLRALAFMFFRLYEQASNIAFAFFGLHCLLVGCLILKSMFLPRIVGALMVCAGLGWLTFSFASLLSPLLARYLSPYIMAPGILGEASLTLWLLVMGVNVQRWMEQASAAAQWRPLGQCIPDARERRGQDFTHSHREERE
jgi:hypothetical protein